MLVPALLLGIGPLQAGSALSAGKDGWVLTAVAQDEEPDQPQFDTPGWHAMLSVEMELEAGDLVRIHGEQQLSEEEWVPTQLTTQLFINDQPVGIAAKQWVRRGTGENHHITFRNFGGFLAREPGLHRIEYRAQLSQPTRVDIDTPRFGSLTVRRFQPAYRVASGWRLSQRIDCPIADAPPTGLLLSRRSQPFAAGQLTLPGPAWAFLSAQSVSGFNPHGAKAEVIVDQLTASSPGGRPRYLYRMGENVTESLRSVTLGLHPAVSIPTEGLTLNWTAYIGNGSGVSRHPLQDRTAHCQALLFTTGPDGLRLQVCEETSLPIAKRLLPEDLAAPLLVSTPFRLGAPSILSVQACAQAEIGTSGQKGLYCRLRPVLERLGASGWQAINAGSWSQRALSTKDRSAALSTQYAFAIPQGDPADYRVTAHLEMPPTEPRFDVTAEDAALSLEVYSRSRSLAGITP